MAEKRAVGHAYNIDFLNVVFAAASLFVLFSTVWLVWDDYDREWKRYQRQFTALELEVTRAHLAAAEQEMDQARVDELVAARETAERQLASSAEQIAELEDQLAEVRRELFVANQSFNFMKATYDVDRYAFEVMREETSRTHNAEFGGVAEELVESEEEVTELYERWVAEGLDVERLTAASDTLQDRIAAFQADMNSIESELATLTGETERLQGRAAELRPSLIDDYLLNAPLLDFMAPTLTVRQTITPSVVDDVNFTTVAKMDRCQTCHLAIDRVGYEDYPQPFRTHPNLETYASSGSPHPLTTTGCTVCHEGMGQSVSFVGAAHSPTSPQQMVEWEEQYGWEESHLWDYPMLPSGMAEASCAKCHKGETFVPEANTLNLAYGMYERAGCYGCHKSVGFEGLRKPGPNLRRIASKLDEAWVANWIREPRAIKASTWMPRVWYNANSSSSEDAVRNEVEIGAVVAYLFANSEEHRPALQRPTRGDPARGQQLVESVGCLACHVMGEESREISGPRRTFGQPLVGLGDKTSYEWLFDWVRNPKHYSPETYMPDLRLTDTQVADVATYLVGLRGEGGVGARASYGEADVDAVLLDYMRSIVPFEEATADLAAMTAKERQLDLGRRAIGRYGCSGCHEIRGFEDAQPIGVELSQEGSKLLPQFDFAFVHEIPHTKRDWIKQKLLAPRIFDRGRILPPLERLRMPNYGFSENEARLLTTAVLSFQRDVQPQAAQVLRSARRDALVAGRNLVRRRNCVACHQIERDGGDYLQLVDDPSLGPPILTPEGAKVKPDWLYAYLRRPIPIRPWLQVRMPSFGLDDAHWNGVLDYFAAISDVVGPFRTHELTTDAATLQTGEELFELLRCQQCHVLDTIPDSQDVGNLAPDLRMARDRLQPDWILDWLITPLDIQPGTRMPAFWTEYPESFYPQFNQDADAQIASIRDYLLTLQGGPSPMKTN